MNLVTPKAIFTKTRFDTPRLKRFSIEEYHRLLEIGFLHEGDRIELIRGNLVEMAAKGTKHIFCCQELSGILHLLINQEAISRCQDPIILASGSEPEPDFAIVRLSPDRYRSRKPEAEDILLIIEVSDSSLEYDRTVKGSLYAEADIQNYWIFNVLDQQLEVYQSPFKNSRDGFEYGSKQVYRIHQTIDLPAPLTGTIVLAEVLP
ncbi:MAG: Uma2 family endonuclease [Alkalinema sp. CAN_BIN05]|nr:Uma2 family endonuclease [Alkalinema sp. CAN_BIN05]